MKYHTEEQALEILINDAVQEEREFREQAAKDKQELERLKRRSARRLLMDIHLDRLNNYLTDAVYAEHNRLSEDHAKALLFLARTVFNTPERED